MIPRDSRGFTLTELSLVMLLAAMVMTGLVTFYMNSQNLWLDSSSQALTQRDATLLLERMTAETRESDAAIVTSDPDSLHQSLTLYNDHTARCRFRWNPADGFVHLDTLGTQATDTGPVTMSRVERFQLDTDGQSLVFLRALWMQSTTGQPVQLSSTMALYNR